MPRVTPELREKDGGDRNPETAVDQLCHHKESCDGITREGKTSAEETLDVYCKPVAFYNAIRRRSLLNPSYLQRCLRYKKKAKRNKRNLDMNPLCPILQKNQLKSGYVYFNYKYNHNKLHETEVTEDFTCPFCLVKCGNFKGLEHHLCACHDHFRFEFSLTEKGQEVDVFVTSVIWKAEVVDGFDPREDTFSLCSNTWKRKRSQAGTSEMPNKSIRML